jgi:hypothetical protein
MSHITSACIEIGAAQPPDGPRARTRGSIEIGAAQPPDGPRARTRGPIEIGAAQPPDGPRARTRGPIERDSARIVLAAAAIVAALAAVSAGASAQNPPSYAAPGDPEIRGIVSSVDGKYQIHLRDRRGYIDNVTLHQGTIINPTGLSLAPGERVTIYGRPSGSTFLANEIDVPAAIAYDPYGYGAEYGYPGYGYGYGPGWGYGGFGFGLGFGFPRFGFGYRGW